MKNAIGCNDSVSRTVAIRRRDGWILPQPAPPSTPKFQVPATQPHVSTCGHDVDLSRWRAIHVLGRNDAAVSLCRSCYLALRHPKPSDTARAKWNALFAPRPRVHQGRGGALAASSQYSRLNAGRAIV